MDNQVPSQNSPTQETSKSHKTIYLIAYVFILIVLTGSAIVYGVKTKPAAPPAAQEETAPTPTTLNKFTGESILGPCNTNFPACSDESYECFNTLMDGPCSNTVQGVVCGNAKEIPGDKLCHHKCESDNDCSEGYYCRSITGFSGDTEISYSMCFEGTSPSLQTSEPTLVQ